MNANYYINQVFPESLKKATKALEAMEIDLERFIKKTNEEVKSTNDLPKGPEKTQKVNSILTKQNAIRIRSEFLDALTEFNQVAIQTIDAIQKDSENEFKRGYKKGILEAKKPFSKTVYSDSDKETIRAGHEFETIQALPHLYQRTNTKD